MSQVQEIVTAAREFLAAVQQRADAATPQAVRDEPWIAQALAADSTVLVEALTAALDTAQFPMAVTDDFSDGYNHALRDVLTAITTALTPKENDS